MKRVATLLGLAIVTLVSTASADVLTFTKLSGLTGGSPDETAVYRADLSSIALGTILSISIQDNSFGLGGATGQFSGFDLDAIKLSSTLVNTADAAQSLTGDAVFNFSSAFTFFTPGSQRAPVNSKLFGTNAAGTAVNNAVATLGSFDANSTTAIPGAFGFLSMGDGGKLSFNLTSAVSTVGKYLYIGEVGDNGELAAGAITVSSTAVPEPSSIVLLSVGILGLAVIGHCRRRRIA